MQNLQTLFEKIRECAGQFCDHEKTWGTPPHDENFFSIYKFKRKRQGKKTAIVRKS